MIPVMDLKRQYVTIEKEIDKAIKRVFAQSNYILGEEGKALEKEFAAYTGAKFAVGVNSGTDALFLALKVLDIKEGDEVITCAFGYIASVLGISYCGAKPVLVDVNPSDFTIDAALIKKAITKRTKAILPVHLYGQMCDMNSIMAIAKKYNLQIIEDCAQAHGAEIQMTDDRCQITDKKNPKQWQKAGTIGVVGCYSFYPTKNLGAYGDGGMVVTDDERIYKKLLLLRDYGRQGRYVFAIKGYNSRLDEFQAAMLREKLKKLGGWNERRQIIAERYRKSIDHKNIVLSGNQKDRNHVYHLFVARVKEREKLQAYLTEKGIGTAIHYPIPIHLQEAYRDLEYNEGSFPEAEKVAKEVLSLPMFPELKEEEADYVCTTINAWKGVR